MEFKISALGEHCLPQYSDLLLAELEFFGIERVLRASAVTASSTPIALYLCGSSVSQMLRPFQVHPVLAGINRDSAGKGFEHLGRLPLPAAVRQDFREV